MFDTVYDVCVYGSGAVAAGAALKMLEKHREVILVSPNGFVCSEMTNSFLPELRSGISKNVDRLIGVLRKAGSCRDGFADPGAMMIKLLNALEDASILFYARPAGIVRENGAMKGLVVAAKNGISCIKARCFIDASGDLEVIRLAQPEIRCVPVCDSISVFNLELDEDSPLPELTGMPDISITGSAWDTDRTVCLRNAARRDIPAALDKIRGIDRLYADALLTRASFSPVPLEDATVCASPALCNLIAPQNKIAFTFEDHAGLVSARMKEGEDLADAADEVLLTRPALEFRPEEVCVASSGEVTECDVLVCGGGTGGALAALAAGRSGVKTVLWEGLDFLGGVGTGGAIPGYYYGVPGGLQNEVDARVRDCSVRLSGRHIPGENQYASRFHPVAKMIVLEQMLAEAGVKVEFNQTVYGAVTERIAPPMFPVLRGTPQPPEMNSVKEVEAVSGADGLRRCRAKVFIDSTGDGDIAVFSGAKYTAGREPDAVQHIFSVPALFLNPNVKDKDGQLLPKPVFNVWTYNIDAGYVDACDPEDVSRARIEAIRAYDRERFWKGSRILSYSAVIGARASRQIQGDYRITLADQIRSSEFPDVIAYSTSHYDNHAADFENESPNAQLWSRALAAHCLSIGCEIPYRAMLPFGVENLIIACRAVSLDFDASMQFRMQRDMQRIGEVAGLAAAQAVQENKPPRYVNIRKVQEQLLKTKALLSSAGNYHCDDWKPANFYPDRRVFELTDSGYAPSRELLPGGVNRYCELEQQLRSEDREVRYAAAIQLAAGARLGKTEKDLVACIESRTETFPEGWQGRTPLWKIAISVCGINGFTGAKKAVEDVMTDPKCLKDLQALVLAVRALGRIGDEQSAKAIDMLLRRGDAAHTTPFFYWCSEQTIEEDSRWKLDLAGFESMYKLGMEKIEYLEKYLDDRRGYVRQAAEQVRRRVYDAE